MKKMLLLGALVVVFGLPAEAFGQRHWDRGDGRIRRGVRSGRLTREEARFLRLRRRELRRDRRSFRRQFRRDWRDDDRRRWRDDDRRRWWRDDDDRRRWGRWHRGSWRDDDRRRGNGYYRRGRGSRSHPVFGRDGRRGRSW